jgi:probable rRNA maturation factor
VIEVNVYKTRDCFISLMAIKRVVLLASEMEKKIRGSIEVGVISKKEIKDLNRRYRGINKPTDVLSFAWSEDAFGVGLKTNHSINKSLGQLYLCPEIIEEHAKRFEVGKKEEFFRMLIHGMLHLVGYDHDLPVRANKMFSKQEKILERVKRI